jgi:maltooligosyltrehalose trehalohydrolase
MLFMGEEWGASTPWRYFTDHEEPELAEAVRTGRREEFAGYGWNAETIPDPQDPATRDSSVLDWSELGKEPHSRLLSWYRDLLALRARNDDLRDDRLDSVGVDYDEGGAWLVVRRGALRVVANLSPSTLTVPLDTAPSYAVMDFAGVELVPDGARLPGHGVAILAG